MAQKTATKDFDAKKVIDGIVLYAKPSGMTSFQSLFAIKRALCTTKIGHTGTLDNFADGLLVVLANKMTKFVSHITAYDKTYEAIIRFGEETDTLDTDGTVTRTGTIPSKEAVQNAVNAFVGNISQVPPAFSAIHVDGMRASDLARLGKAPTLNARNITVYNNTLIEYKDGYAHIKVHCSKGTYIRALARDIACHAGTVAHLVALRRLSVGNFLLQDAAGANLLPNFCIDNLSILTQKKDKQDIQEASSSEILSCVQTFTPQLAKLCGFDILFLKPKFYEHFFSGKPLKPNLFENFLQATNTQGANDTGTGAQGATGVQGAKTTKEFVVFADANAVLTGAGSQSTSVNADGTCSHGVNVCTNLNANASERFVGLVKMQNARLSYGFVIQGKGAQ